MTANTKGEGGGWTIREGVAQYKMPDPIRRAEHHSTQHSRHSTGPPCEQKGDTTHKTGRPATRPPFTHHATHHPLCHPTIHDGPTLHHDEGGVDRGYPTTRTAQTHTHHPHATHLARNSARHDSSTRQHCSGMSRARVTPLHWAGQQQHTPPPFHTPKRMDTIHSPTHHSHSFTFTQQMINVDHRTTINVQ